MCECESWLEKQQEQNEKKESENLSCFLGFGECHITGAVVGRPVDTHAQQLAELAGAKVLSELRLNFLVCFFFFFFFWGGGRIDRGGEREGEGERMR